MNYILQLTTEQLQQVWGALMKQPAETVFQALFIIKAQVEQQEAAALAAQPAPAEPPGEANEG
jgi:hypothetical protein